MFVYNIFIPLVVFEDDNMNYCNNCSDSDICSIPFLDNMPEEQKEYLQLRAVKKTYSKKSRLFHEGEHVDSIYIIRKGRVKLTRSDASGNEQIVGIFSDNETIWEGLMVKGSRFPYSAECLTRTSVCALKKDELMKVLDDPYVMLDILAMLSQKLHDANERILVLSVKEPKNRLAAFLLYRKKRSSEEVMQLTLDNIAASISLRPETVSRKLNELIREGYIAKVGKSGIQILDYDGLKDFQ